MPYFGVLTIWILLFGVPYEGPLFSETPILGFMIRTYKKVGFRSLRYVNTVAPTPQGLRVRTLVAIATHCSKILEKATCEKNTSILGARKSEHSPIQVTEDYRNPLEAILNPFVINTRIKKTPPSGAVSLVLGKIGPSNLNRSGSL